MNTAQQFNREAQLSLPLFFDEGTVEPIVTAKGLTLFSKPDPRQEIKELGIDRVTWSDDNIKEFREAFLWHNLKILADGRAGAKAKEEVFEWVMSEEEHPFSFLICCALCGYDHFELRSGIKFSLRQLKVAGLQTVNFV